jgi:putative tryptophan/tyrosine transport system substrate-binding protein
MDSEINKMCQQKITTVMLVASLNRPGGNLTGVGFLANALAPKLLEVLHELVAKAMAVGMLVNPGSPNAEADTREIQAAARLLGHQVLVLNARSETDIDAAFATLVQHQAGGLILSADPLFWDRRSQIIALAARHDRGLAVNHGRYVMLAHRRSPARS